MPRENWSPPTSSVRSFAAAIPKQLPLDANPEFEAFKRQADANRGRSSFSLSGSHFGAGTPALSRDQPPQTLRPRPPRWHTHGSDTGSDFPTAKTPAVPSGLGKAIDLGSSKMDVDPETNSLHDSAYVSADSKRNSEASLNPPFFLNMPRHESPAQVESSSDNRSGLSKVDDRHPRLSLVHNRADPPSPDFSQAIRGHRGNTVPQLDTGGPSMMPPAQLKELLQSPNFDKDVLLLDLRVSPQFAMSRIKGALNLCIPTTLLKRATFNLQKLQQTFQGDGDQGRFSKWREAKYLVVYDAFSSEKRDAVSAVNMLKKFTNEGYDGTCAILRGGFNGFAAAYPDLIDNRSASELATGNPTLSLGSTTGTDSKRPSVAPVIGGVMLPTTSNNPNPFFSNIRQNQDLRDGVGQLDVSLPPGVEMETLPQWLRAAVDSDDHGKKVSDKFLQIELAEQSRMKDAYSMFQPTSQNPVDETERVQLSGIEKGGKNRYKDILPFEHARVRLMGRPEGSCDYVNASHITASRSHKQYIATQGPLPATFEDFWSVIWDQDVRVIVMLTAESEGGQLKCHPYWNSREFGSIRLKSLSEKKVSLDIDKHRSHSNVAALSTASSESSSGSATASIQHHDSFGFGAAMATAEMGRRRANTTTTLEGSTPTPVQPKLGRDSSGSGGETPYVIIRKFALSHAAHPFAPIREITHLHYPSWPDFGAPAQPSHLLALVELANVMQRAALPVDVPGAIASASSGSDSAESSPAGSKTGKSPGLKRKADTIPLAWHDEPETDAKSRPMLVHCSAGCGRTGTFCTVDSVIDMLKRQRLRNVRRANRNIERRVGGFDRDMDAEGDISMGDEPLIGSHDTDPFEDAVSPRTATAKMPEFPRLRSDRASFEDEFSKVPGLDLSWMNDDGVDLIATTVEDFRRQRLSMVQSLRQFVLCYETVLEWIWRLQERGGPAGSTGPGALRGRGRSGTFTN